MSQFKLKITSKDELFGFKNKQTIHYEKDFSAYLKYLLRKGILSANSLKEIITESTDEMTTAINDTIEESTTETADKINNAYGKLIK